MRLVEGGKEDVDRSFVSAVLGRMGVIWDCLPSFLTTTGTTVEFTTLEPQLSTERLTAAELASDTALLGQMEGMHIPRVGSLSASLFGDHKQVAEKTCVVIVF